MRQLIQAGIRTIRPRHWAIQTVVGAIRAGVWMIQTGTGRAFPGVCRVQTGVSATRSSGIGAPRFGLAAAASSLVALATTLTMPSSSQAQCPSGWSVPGDPLGWDGSIYSLATMTNGDVVASGGFRMAGGASVNLIGRWNGASWSPLSSGLNGAASALIVMPDGTLIAVGSFFVAGCCPASYIARFNGVYWDPLGGGLDAPAKAITALTNGDVIVGGGFDFAGGVRTSRIARWNGQTWSAMGAGITTPGGFPRVQALVTLPNGDVIAGGAFSMAGGVSVNSVARWNGTSWLAMGSGLTAEVEALAVLPNGDVIAGGSFRSSNGAPANYIARWNGAEWSAMGQGVDYWVKTLKALPNGDVIAGGLFTNAGGVSANHIARWNGAAWSALGSGRSSDVYAITSLPNGDLIAGGSNTVAGNNRVVPFARYTFGALVPTILAQPMPLTVCASAAAGLSLTAIAGASPISYQWRRDTVPINPATNPSAATPTLTINTVRGVDAGLFDCIVMNSCGSVTSNAAMLTVCVADFDDGNYTGTCDGGVTIDDLLYYFGVFSAGTSRADIDDGSATGTPDGGVTIEDLLYYLTRFDAGC